MRARARGRYIRGNLSYRLRTVKKSSRIYFLFSALLAAGIVSGALFGGSGSESFRVTFEGIFQAFKSGNLRKLHVFVQSIVKQSIFVTVMWAMPFLVKKSLPAFFLVWLRGAGLGFTTRLLIMEYGIKGFFYAFAVCFTQNAVLLAAYYLAFYNCMETLLYKKGRAALNVGALLMSFSLVVFSALMEVYFIPVLIRIFFL